MLGYTSLMIFIGFLLIPAGDGGLHGLGIDQFLQLVLLDIVGALVALVWKSPWPAGCWSTRNSRS